MADAKTPLPIDARSRAWALLAAGCGLLPLLWQLPRLLALGIGVAALVCAALSWRKPVPAALRFLLALAMLAAVLWTMGMHMGRDTGCALLAAMLAIKPAETASLRDARSLLGFALFAPFAAFLLDQGPLTMLLGLVAVLAALIALLRLADAEAGVHEEAGLSALFASLRKLAATGRLLLIGLPLAMAAFWLFPRLAEPLWGVPERAIAQPGLADEMSPGQWLDFMVDDTPALRVQFFGAVPKPQQMYWRGPVLWDFDGRTWKHPPWLPGYPENIEYAANAPVWDYQIDYEPTDRHQLVALDLLREAPQGAQLSRDHSLSANAALSALTRWRLRSSPAAGYQADLPKLLRAEALRLPPGFNPRTLALGRQWRAEAGTGPGSDAAIARRALDWIHRDFAYTLETPLPGHDGVDEFLFVQQKGFCEHFSSAFVVLMRAAGIPARVVTGYVGGVRNPYGDYYVVRKMNAHAWAEIWLQGHGWVRYDPTAAVAPERIYDTAETHLGTARDSLFAGTGAGLARQWNRLADFGDYLRRNWNEMLLGFNAQRQAAMLQSFGIKELDQNTLGLLFAVSATLAMGAMAWLLARGERERDPLLRAWHRLGTRYARLGLGRASHEAAQAWAQRVAVQRPQAAQTLVPLSERFAEQRYASPVNRSQLRALLRELYRHRP